MKVFFSSTIQDLAEYREAVYKAVRHLGHQSVAMEQWAASEQAPVEASLEAVRESGVLVLLIAWRYGYVPPGQQYSMTELEWRAAREAGIPCLVFLVPDDAPWPLSSFDQDQTRIARFRRELLEQHVVSFFTSPDVLAKQVAVALHRWTAGETPEPSPTPPEAVEAVEAPAAEVFVSYAHEDQAMAQAVSTRLTEEKWSVFWDRKIPVGMIWEDLVEAALDAAQCVVVLWSPASRDSEWVRIEATEGAERKILAPAVVEKTTIPLRFRRIQTANLIGWTPELADSSGIVDLVSAVRRYVEGGKPT
jgi:hypothetical protein